MIIYWLRKEFRSTDNPAFFQAVKRSRETQTPLTVLFCLDDNILDEKNNIGYPGRFHLSKLLANFKAEFPFFQIVHSSPEQVFSKLSTSQKIEVWANNDIEPYPRFRDKQVFDLLQKNGSSITFLADQSSINLDVRSQEGKIYQVFTPFKKAVWQDFTSKKPLAKPDLTGINFNLLNPTLLNVLECLEIRKVSTNSNAEGSTQNSIVIAVDNLNILKNFDKKEIYLEIQAKLWKILDTPWILIYGNNAGNNQTRLDLDNILPRPNLENWPTSELECQDLAKKFIGPRIEDYKNGRDDLSIIDNTGTSRLSMALKWGLISSRWLMNEIIQKYDPNDLEGVNQYISELIWREFYRYVMWHNPKVLNLEIQSRFIKTDAEGNKSSGISWLTGDQAHQRFLSWIQGKTGYPLVDAGMDEIAKTGWMHNRTRMVVASILTKNLGIDWRWGQDYFRAILVDLDEASNNGGWQWAASTGSDPKPIRIFNPYLQAEKYDKINAYQTKWLPKDYLPNPIIEHSQARLEAMARYGLGGGISRMYLTDGKLGTAPKHVVLL